MSSLRRAIGNQMIIVEMNKKQILVTQMEDEYPGRHSDYFAELESKLLEESDTLTNFIGKSLITQKSLKQLKRNLSASTLWAIKDKLVSGRCKGSARSSKRKESSKKSHEYLEKAKNLVKAMKTTHNLKDSCSRSNPVSPRYKYQNLRKVVYSICKNSKEQKERTHTMVFQKEQPHKNRKGTKMTPQFNSLKETISTQSEKSSLQFMSEQLVPQAAPQKIKLDDFVPLKLLGQGKMGQVCLVQHKKTGFTCALKQIPQSQIANNPKMLMQITRQIKSQLFLDHPNIVQLYSVFVQDGNLYLLMQLCADGDLYQHLKTEGSFSEEKIRMVMRQICHAVEYVHDNDILHRDLKPQNILFHENIVKICDFGWAVHSPLLRDTLCGTPLYSSPEIVQKQQYDNKIDIWNIGILMYELVFGRVPFQIRSEDDIIKVVQEDIYFPRSRPASPEIKDFILRCLSKNPKDRFTTAKLIDHQFLNPGEIVTKTN